MSTRCHYRPERTSAALALVLALGLMWSACDSTGAESRSSLVVEAFVQAGAELPAVRVSQTAGREADRNTVLRGLSDAVVTVHVGGVSHAYHHVGGGRYASLLPAETPIRAGDPFLVEVERDGIRATGRGTVPPDISLIRIAPVPARSAVEAVLVDSLGLSIDSLDVGLGARLGFIIPVEIELIWNSLQEDYWVATSLDPEESFSSSVLDFFLLTAEVMPEAGRQSATWKGVYAVPVADSTSSLPSHDLLVSITRGDSVFAAWMSTRTSGMASAGAGNVQGAAGFIGGIAIDTVRVRIRN